MHDKESLQQVSEQRLDRLRAKMRDHSLDTFVVYTRPNAWYLSQLECTSSALVITEASAFFLTDFRYAEAARRHLPACWELVVVQGGNLTKAVGGVVTQRSQCKVGFEGQAPYDFYRQLSEELGEERQLVEAGGILRELRAVKDAHEIELIAMSQKLNESILKDLIEHFRRCQEDFTELNVQTYVRQQILERGLEEAFPTIVAANENAALPHAVPESRSASHADVLLIDMGVKFQHYCSDMTRTLLRERALSSKRRATLRTLFDVVLEAQQLALETVKSGVEARMVDAAARSVIEKAGYGEFFGHGLGHGVGIEIHEAPTLNPHSSDILKAGMLITIEPGVYLPGIGGVRIEDLVVVTDEGCKNLTQFRKDPYLLDER